MASPEASAQQPGDKSLRARGFLQGVRDLSPAYFAMVMATGIVSIAAHLYGLWFIALPLFWLNVIVFFTLWILTVLRLIWYCSAVVADLTNHERGPGFFTTVAGSCLLGSQCVVIFGNITAAI